MAFYRVYEEITINQNPNNEFFYFLLSDQPDDNMIQLGELENQLLFLEYH